MALAKTTFATSPDDSLITVDSYKAEGIIITKDDETESTQEAVNVFIPTKPTSTRNKEGVDEKPISADVIKKGVIASTDGLPSFKSLPTNIQKQLLQTNAYSKVKVVLNGVEDYINDVDVVNVKGLVGMVKSVSGCEFPIEVTDSGSMVSLGSNIIKEATEMNILGVYQTFMLCLTDRYVGSNITKEVSAFASKKGNLDLLKQISIGPFVDEVKSYAPSIVKDFAANFKLPKGTKNTQYTSMLRDMFSAFNKLKPNWNKAGDKISLSELSNGSDDFKKLLASENSNTRVDIPQEVIGIDTSSGFTDKQKIYALMSVTDKAKKSNTNLFATPSELLKSDFPLVA